MRLAGRGGISPALLNAAVYLLLAAAMLGIVLVRTQGHFTYCLDDPYIHLALAERLRHGLYGLNTSEPASPSSSILWPLLFVPFAGTALMPWLPLLVNVVCGTATAVLLGSLVRRTFGSGDRSAILRWSVPLLSAVLVVALNLVGLTFTGLEHSLQVLLCVLCAFAVARAMRGEHVPGWAIFAAIVLPSVRYEGLLITVGFAMMLAGQRAWRTACGVVAASIAVPAAFSIFLHRLGLPWFPLSVLVKSSYKFADQSSLPRRVARLILGTLKQSLFDPERLPQLLITVVLIALAWKYRRTRRLVFALSGAALVGAAQVVLGPVGWFYRYEIYALAYTLVVLIAAVAIPATVRVVRDEETANLGERFVGGSASASSEAVGKARQIPALLLVAVALLAAIYIKPLLTVPRAAVGIYEQQYQLGRLAGEFYHAPVAVNDLGWVSFRRTPDQYTLDLYGLGSYEAFRTKEKDRTPDWLDAITREHRAGLVAIYPEWFKKGVPTDWVPVAKLCAADVDTSLGPLSQRVMLYRTQDADAAAVESAIAQWRIALPARVQMQVNPVDNSSTCR